MRRIATASGKSGQSCPSCLVGVPWQFATGTLLLGPNRSTFVPAVSFCFALGKCRRQPWLGPYSFEPSAGSRTAHTLR
jgi:hypothetical protein